MSEQRTCNSCGYTGVDLVRVFDCAKKKSMCSRCVDRDDINPDAIQMADKLAQHQANGTLEKYSLRQRLADLDGKIIH
jgi:hypothetical protein